MTFESKKIIEQDRIVQSSKLILLSIVQLVGMFVLGVGLVFGGLKAYNLIKEHVAVNQSTSVTTAQKKEEQLTSIINGLMVGVGGKGHRGAYNTDTLIVVSYNPATKQLNMISLPRDLYIQIDGTYYGRINSVLDYYLSKKMTLSGALEQLSHRVGDLIGQNIHYYGLIDFKGFESMIDTLGGLKVTVPEDLYDPTFPVDDFNYGVLSIDSGTQMMDGNTALNYARSRHSTSDFDRSKRQQIIIHALLDKLLSFQSVTKIKGLYDDFQNTVTTNAGVGDIIKYLPYISKIRAINNIVFQSDCPENINQMKPGCVLYSPPRDAFGGAAVLLPIGATPQRVSNYTELFQFVNRIIYHPFGSYKAINLGIYNSIDPKITPKSVGGFASQLGVELIRYGIAVDYVGNNINKLAQTTAILNTGMKQKDFIEYIGLIEEILDVGSIQIAPQTELPVLYSGKALTGVDVVLLIGSDSVLGNGKGLPVN